LREKASAPRIFPAAESVLRESLKAEKRGRRDTAADGGIRPSSIATTIAHPSMGGGGAIAAPLQFLSHRAQPARWLQSNNGKIRAISHPKGPAYN
jgi:hypothetical protein